VLGFGLRDLFADVFTGLAINMDRSFVIGDWVQVNEGGAGMSVGKINEIGWRCTSLTTEEQTNVVIPNGLLGTEHIVNITRPMLSTRYEASVTVEFSVSPDRVKRVLMAALRSLDTVPGFDTEKPPVVLIHDTSELGIEYLLRYWILPWNPISPTSANDRVYGRVLAHLRAAGIGLAYPKTDIYTARMPARQFDSHRKEDLVELLAQTDVFKLLDAHSIASIVDAMERQHIPENQVLFHQGDKGKSLFVLIEGLLEIDVESDGHAECVGRIHPGQCLGEMSLLTGERRSATVRAASESIVYEVGKKSITLVMQQQPALAEALSNILAERQISTAMSLSELDPAQQKREIANFAQQLFTRMRDFLELYLSAPKAQWKRWQAYPR
ncbi:MAG: mechanosensitive ion channel family protein, partial [Xanthomonadales bacterium]|nr:mechanosensitive ion channel family protein [Xanthomonadales bacterium]